jgi:hypothetical protein
MASWRSAVSLVLLLLAATQAGAQTYALAEPLQVGSHFRLQLNMSLSGELKIHQEGKLISLKESATATHDYVERILAADAHGLAVKTARFYKTAKVEIVIDDHKEARTLRPERSLMIAQRAKDQTLVYSPKGPLAREELELTEHFETLAPTGLLPAKEVAVGDSWKVANLPVQLLCHFEGLTAQDLSCKLESVKDQVARVALSGTASGIDRGATVKLTIRGHYLFDLKARRLTALEWKQTDERDQGPVSPAAAVTITTTVTRTPIETAEEVNDVALVIVPEGDVPPDALTQLVYQDSKKRFDIAHTRDWQLVGQSEEHLVLRLMDRGDFVAQATVTPWKKMPAGKHQTGAEFAAVIAKTPGWEQEKVLESKEISAPKGLWIYRVAAEGQLDGLKALQYFYLIAGPEGDQLLVAFTMTPAQAQKLDTRDVTLIRGITLPTARSQEPQMKAP